MTGMAAAAGASQPNRKRAGLRTRGQGSKRLPKLRRGGAGPPQRNCIRVFVSFIVFPSNVFEFFAVHIGSASGRVGEIS